MTWNVTGVTTERITVKQYKQETKHKWILKRTWLNACIVACIGIGIMLLLYR